jgi:RimJ/RimL family protein N-acetyltransferase
MHLHMWEEGMRGKGYGATLFCLATLDFFERFRLRRIVCEPSRRNPLPNAMLRRIGFSLSGTRVGRSSELSAVTELNTYEIDREVAERWLRSGLAGPTT